MILTPSPKPAAEAARAAGAKVNPPDAELARAAVVVLAVKPAAWRPIAADLEPKLGANAVVISVMAGVGASVLKEAFPGKLVARVMPTTGVAAERGSASIWAETATARDMARALFAPVAEMVDLETEGLLDAATAVSGSAPAYIFEFAAALARAGVAEGLTPEAAMRLARGAVTSAAVGLEGRSMTLDQLIGQIASPGGTTEAALRVLRRDGQLDRLVGEAVQAAITRAQALGRS
jgi:pyrroline-5-carboxylate reductase